MYIMSGSESHTEEELNDRVKDLLADLKELGLVYAFKPEDSLIHGIRDLEPGLYCLSRSHEKLYIRSM